MAKAIKLKLNPEIDFTLIGISAAEPIYRMAWLINQTLNISLAEDRPIKLFHAKLDQLQSFSRFSHISEELSVSLVKNKTETGLWIEEYKQLDYFLKIECLQENKDWVTAIKDIENISLALKIEPGSIKNKDRLFYTEEAD